MEDKNKKYFYNKFGIGNFKSFQDVQEIDIAPITLIFGQNSGGKTSLLQSILSLSQSFEEINEGKFQLSGTKIDAGTFETALNNKSKNNEIILEISNKSEFDDGNPRGGYPIQTFQPIYNSKVRLFVKPGREISNLRISKIEIIFSDYLEDLTLTFNGGSSVFILPNSTHSAYVPFGNGSSSIPIINNDFDNTYSLSPDSKKVIKEITERCFNNLCENFKKLFSKREQEGDWFNENTSEYTVNFGKLKTRDYSRKINPNFLCFIRHAAIASGSYVSGGSRRMFDNHYFLLKEFKSSENNPFDKKIINIIKKSSNEIFKQSLCIFEINGSLFPIQLATFISRERGVFYRQSKNQSQTKFDSLSAEINFISNFTGTKKIFNPKNVFRKIELIQDNYIDKIIGIDLINFPGKEMSLEKYYSIKEKLFSVNTKFIKIENSFLQILEPFKSDFRKNHKTVQSRQYIRDSIKKFSFDDPLNTELDLRILKDEIRLFINGLNQTNLESDISDQFEEINQIDIITNLVKEIKTSHDTFVKRRAINPKVTPAKYYKEDDDNDIRYIKNQIIHIFTTGFLLRKLVNNIQTKLKKVLIKTLIKKDILKTSLSEFNAINTLIWLLSSQHEDEIELEEYESIVRNLTEHINREFPRFYLDSLDDYITDGSFTNHLNHLIPTPFISLPIIPSSFNKHVIHLGPSRPGAKRFYTNQDIEKAEADDVAYFLKTQAYKNKEEELNIKNLNSYLSRLDIVTAIEPVKSEDPRYDFKSILVKSNSNSKAVNLADTGYGLSQLFPIIINAIARNADTILIQQPETHLHPRLQAEVGSILVDSIKRSNFNRVYGSKHWIVETHSEIMLLRILKRIRNGDFEAEKLRVYYVDQNKEKGSVIKRMQISKEGEMITQWPKGFFSNDIDEMFDL